MTVPGPDAPAIEPSWDDTQVALSLIGQLIEEHPDWRLTSHFTESGQRATLIEFTNQDGEFADGLPTDFVSFISERETVADTERGESDS